MTCAKAAFSSSASEDIKLVEQLLEQLKNRESSSDDVSSGLYAGPAFNIKTFNNISSVGLKQFDERFYKMNDESEHHAILLRSHKLQESDVQPSVRAIARCGAGVNNIPVGRMTELGIPVFNTPGSNANSVKELTVCAMLLASRDILGGINHVKQIYTEETDHGTIHKRVEKEKKLFVGQELAGKTLGVVGLGNIGSMVAAAATSLGMNVVGYDPMLTVDTALALPHSMKKANDLDSVLKAADYLSLHVPYSDKTHHLLKDELLLMKPEAHIFNFSRGELIDSASLAALYKSGHRTGKYVTDFVDEDLNEIPEVVIMPHLGASTGEAEENSASMAAIEVRSFLERGSIVNSVNFPECELGPVTDKTNRLCIINQNIMGVLGNVSTVLGDSGINILKQINVSRGDIAYTVVEFEGMPESSDDMQMSLLQIDGVLSSRFVGIAFHDDLYGVPGTHYKVRHRDLM
jgi:D-3-phosphoglycerate dehydrogenase